MYRTRKKINSVTLGMLYQTLIQPYLDYCNIIWSVGESQSLHKLFIKQKKAIRAITFSKWDAHTSPIFKKLRILKLHEINTFQTCCFVFKSLHNLLPVKFHKLFLRNQDIHDHDTRKKQNIHVISHRINVRAQSIRIHGQKVWNALPINIRDSPTFPIFKNHCKKYILN